MSSDMSQQAPRASDRGRSLLLLAAGLAPLILAAGCASFPTLETVTAEPATDRAGPDDDAPGASSSTQGNARQRPDSLRIPGRPAPDAPTRLPATDAQIAALIPDEMVDATLAPQSIPEFAATVFGGLLGVPYTLTPDVSTREERIAGGTGGTLNKRDLFRLTQQSLRQYGVEVYIDGAFVTVGAQQNSEIGSTLTRGRALPTGAGRVVQFFPVQTIEVNAIQGLVEGLFPNLGGARITPDQLSNTLIISGSTREVAQVVRVLTEIDQPRFAGAEVVRVEPIYSSAEVLATSLESALATEGYVVSRQSAAGRAITIQTFPVSNQILVFTKDPVLAERVRFWVDTLDQPASMGDKQSTFVYQVRETDAQSLGQLAMGQAPSTLQARRPVGVPGATAVDANSLGNTQSQQAVQGAGGQYLSGRLLVDPINNRILFTGTASDYASLRQLLRTLDTPAPQVAIEVMVAEVTLTDSTSLGVNLFGTEVRGDGIAVGSTEGIDIGGGGLLLTFTGPEFRAALNAQASNNRINILQRPQLVTRSGVSATFQVGSDVPIITSQRATDFSSGGNGTDVLQSVQYRQTGVILQLTPIVYGDRVDIQINQEISEVGEPQAGSAIASPPILNRSLSTQIAIADGWTGVLGGLISNNYSKSNTGVPFLKDIPIVGSAFQSNTVGGRRTELLILITPRILRTNEDIADFADQASRDMDAAFRTGSGWSYTLTPFSLGTRIRGVGLNLPGPQRASERRPLFGGERPEAEPDVEALSTTETGAPADTPLPPPPPPSITPGTPPA